MTVSPAGSVLGVGAVADPAADADCVGLAAAAADVPPLVELTAAAAAAAAVVVVAAGGGASFG